MSTNTGPLDAIARHAGGSPLRAQVAGDTAIVVFESCANDAKRLVSP